MKKTIKENYRVEVYPDIWPANSSHSSYMSSLRDIRKSIERHIDDVSDIRDEFDTKEVCGFCGTEWGDAIDEDGIPWCCDEAIKEAKCESHLAELSGEEVCQK
jgi:hypothetical protein